MEAYADAGCVLKVNVNCEACKMKLHEVLRSVSGEYSITIDAEEGLAKINGELDPNILLWALSRNGKHAELKWVKLRSPAPRSMYPYNDEGYRHGYGYRYGYEYEPYGNYGETYDQTWRRQRALPEGMWHDTHQSHYYPQTRNHQSGARHYGSFYEPIRRCNCNAH